MRFLGLPLRLFARTGFYSTITQNFCGFGNAITCDLAEAQDVADRLSLTGDDKELFARRYYLGGYSSKIERLVAGIPRLHKLVHAKY